MTSHLPPIEKPSGLMLKLGYRYTRRQFGQVPGPLSVFCARMPPAFTKFYGRIGKLDRKLSLPQELATLIRGQVASVNQCAFCMDSNRWAALKQASVPAAKLDALADFESSPAFTERERSALRFATEVTVEKSCSRATFAELQSRFDEREICELVWLVASEHLYNINNVALNIGSAGMCAAEPGHAFA